MSAEDPGRTAEPSGLAAFLRAHRRRIGGVVLVLLLVLLATHGASVLPSTLTLELPLADAASVSHVEVSLRDADGVVAYRLERSFAGDAPAALAVESEVLPGRYDVELRVTRNEADSRLVGLVEAPADGTVRVALHQPEE